VLTSNVSCSGPFHTSETRRVALDEG
jgi:hypothetical protein